jgi:hypothetical protein
VVAGWEVEVEERVVTGWEEEVEERVVTGWEEEVEGRVVVGKEMARAVREKAVVLKMVEMVVEKAVAMGLQGRYYRCADRTPPPSSTIPRTSPIQLVAHMCLRRYSDFRKCSLATPCKLVSFVSS